MLFKATVHPRTSEISQLFGPLVDKWDISQITLFRWKCSKMGKKYIGFLAKDYHIPNFL